MFFQFIIYNIYEESRLTDFLVFLSKKKTYVQGCCKHVIAVTRTSGKRVPAESTVTRTSGKQLSHETPLRNMRPMTTQQNARTVPTGKGSVGLAAVRGLHARYQHRDMQIVRSMRGESAASAQLSPRTQASYARTAYNRFAVRSIHQALGSQTSLASSNQDDLEWILLMTQNIH